MARLYRRPRCAARWHSCARPPIEERFCRQPAIGIISRERPWGLKSTKCSEPGTVLVVYHTHNRVMPQILPCHPDALKPGAVQGHGSFHPPLPRAHQLCRAPRPKYIRAHRDLRFANIVRDPDSLSITAMLNRAFSAVVPAASGTRPRRSSGTF
ncbi:hypothetical protein GGR57DRAFT_488513 [Xylariaceae sp. FL1272]|nr:hypothetical protein GGR57DRAFT_488513 [Xylariaceae sp. FL1272]